MGMESSASGKSEASAELADVAVVGAGGAGLLAGIAAARTGARTVLYERMAKPAKKVAISGGGRCNFSNNLPPRQFVRLFGDPNAAFLGHALRAFSKEDLFALLAKYGIEGQVEKEYRLYTKSGRGSDVVKALVEEFRKAGGILVTGAPIRSVVQSVAGAGYDLANEEAGGAAAPPGALVCQARTVVICTGGLSYPATGSTGDGYAWARAFGHGVTPLRPALVGLQLEEEWPRALSGLAWEDAEAALFRAEGGTRNADAKSAGAAAGIGADPVTLPTPPFEEGENTCAHFSLATKARLERPLAVERAEILFTHFGISGPAILDLSNAYVRAGLERARLRLDFFPDVSREELDQRLCARLKQQPTRRVSGALSGLLPARLLEHLERTLGASGAVPASRLPKAARLQLLTQVKGLELTVVGTRGMEFGEVTAGGVEWEGLDPATLESHFAAGLFFAGEILDLAGRCGGFNLQAAFSTGYLAGREAARCAAEESKKSNGSNRRDQ